MKESQINPKDFTKTIGAYSHGLKVEIEVIAVKEKS
jgi:hypothetical protein